MSERYLSSETKGSNMIDEDRTMQLFEYTSDELSKGSGKKVVAVCEECGIYRCVRKRSYRDLCFICSRSRTGENNPLWKEKVVKICEICGKEFPMSPSLSQQRFCSRKCQSKWQSEARSGENCPRWKGGKVIKVCEVCGKEFSVNHCQADVLRCCSRECQGKWRSENMRGENNPLWKEKVVKICEICGKEFFVHPSQSNSRRCCSRGCKGKWISENMSGENSPFFGKTPSLEVRKRVSATLQGISYDDWESFAEDQPYCPKFNEVCRESNREKYDRCCFLSGTTEAKNGKKLSVHHIDMDKNQGCDGHAWKLVPLSTKWHGHAHTPTWMARIQYLLNHVWSGA